MEDRKQRLIEALENECKILEKHGHVNPSADNQELIKFLKTGVPPEYNHSYNAYDDFIEDPETFYAAYLN